ncbi:hypothetical protein HY485_01300 [Candidatus Woesearchaeota archaeon]|nr:hypothetical protein [Candidatus Woesearchaeota archaeon]
MADINFEQIKKLPPDQRIKVLNQLQEQIQKLIKERQQEIEDAQALLKRAEEELRVIQEIETPKPKQIHVEELFGKKEEEEEETLENIARRDIPQPDELAERLEQKPISEIYQRLNEITGEIRESGVITQYQENWMRAANYITQEREKAIQEHKYNATDKAEHQLSAAEKIIQNYIN